MSLGMDPVTTQISNKVLDGQKVCLDAEYGHTCLQIEKRLDPTLIKAHHSSRVHICEYDP